MSKSIQSIQPTTTKSGAEHAALGLRRLLLLLMIVSPIAGWGQSADIAGEGKESEASDDSSQHVEESDEAYRRRMETAESHDQADVMRPRSGGTAKVPEGIDALPADSRKHLRDELRNVIIEQGEWQPEDASKVYPYTPSAAAEKDPELRQQEEKAWGELIAEYHKREAAALAAGGGRSGGQDHPGEEQTGSSGSGQQGQAGSSSAAGKSSPHPSERSAKDAASSSAAGAGVSQSALEFLKNQSGGQAGGQSVGQAGGQTGGQPGSQAANTSMNSGSSAAGQQQSPPEQQPQNAVADAAADKPKNPDQEKSDKAEPTPPPGSVAIAELVALEENAKRRATEQAKDSENPESAAASEPSTTTSAEKEATPKVTLRSSDQPPPPPGTIAIPELEKLKGMDEAAPLAVKLPDSEN